MKYHTDEFKKNIVGVFWLQYREPQKSDFQGDFTGIVTITNQSTAISGSSQLWNRIISITKVREDPLKTLLDKWLYDNTGYDEKSWPVLKECIEHNRLSSRRRFRE